uniref:Uncharacterized protein n=1 Tax=Chromera velia CCMP2878 TaxID=1169474 RepID=A0A0G4HXR7_9ALVE|mmetsp:Transcript_30045/g.58985  ORF Transcript_30045/g.58985 Transcript_30045/m.58985 type:complete len:150 (-) Transcript_30045:1298-1747(-)|eukprot:Cvel_9328.t1-p1 / transcript=Cvel_9328.t1 / gene=Cvel_9328 / organism=Chromera_velia_CCMP2878 / gene_product=hypothetical protein / transcript_product=hypothetical protein / location=Cvel_scaffold535:29844-30290(+) / protein_length=149 / sequence_SO=supercontig / SO=protein_coding / is_pseudo=false
MPSLFALTCLVALAVTFKPSSGLTAKKWTSASSPPSVLELKDGTKKVCLYKGERCQGEAVKCFEEGKCYSKEDLDLELVQQESGSAAPVFQTVEWEFEAYYGDKYKCGLVLFSDEACTTKVGEIPSPVSILPLNKCDLVAGGASALLSG